MRICLLSPTFLPKLGGVETVVSSLAEQYVRLGHEVVVVTQHLRHGRCVDNYAYPVIRYRRPWSFRFSWGLASIRRALAEAWQGPGFDAIHCHLAYPAGPVAVQFGRRVNCPVIITSHGSDIREDSRYRRRGRVWRRLVWGLRQADALTAISGAMQRLLGRIVPGKAVVRIPNGVDVEGLNQPGRFPEDGDRLQRLRDRPFALAMGGLTAKKGFDVLLEGLGGVGDGLGEFSLAIAGDGRQRPVLEQLVQRHGLSGRVHLVGWVRDQRKRWLLQNCRFVVLPSRTESFSLVALEAYACGKAVLASRVGGLAELVEDQVTGRLVEPEDPAALGEAMVWLCRQQRWKQLGDNARRVAQRYDWSQVAGRYLQLYEQLCVARSRA